MYLTSCINIWSLRVFECFFLISGSLASKLKFYIPCLALEYMITKSVLFHLVLKNTLLL